MAHNKLRLEKTEGVFGPTIQGEGMNIGMPVSFVRFYGCDFRCSWCDTPFALGKDMGGSFDEVAAEDILARLDYRGVRSVVLSGGNPLIQPKQEFERFLRLLSDANYYIQVETQGSITPTSAAVEMVDFWSLSPKLPSAGKRESENWDAVQWFITHISLNMPHRLQLKFVISTLADYTYVKNRLTTDLSRARFDVPIILQPEGMQLEKFDIVDYQNRLSELCHLVGSDQFFWYDYQTVRVLPQLHKVIWGVERRR